MFSSKNIDRLKRNKIKIQIGHKKKNLSNATILIISSAIKKSNPEYLEAKKKKIPIYKRGEMLANVVSLYKNVVVAGSHGKTTTTSIIASIFSSHFDINEMELLGVLIISAHTGRLSIKIADKSPK